jgi:hypothetical protein
MAQGFHGAPEFDENWCVLAWPLLSVIEAQADALSESTDVRVMLLEPKFLGRDSISFGPALFELLELQAAHLATLYTVCDTAWDAALEAGSGHFCVPHAKSITNAIASVFDGRERKSPPCDVPNAIPIPALFKVAVPGF